MITLVYWEEVESAYSDGEMAAVDGDSEILTATELVDDALDYIKKHQEENEGRDIQYMLMFWLDGEVVGHSTIEEDTPIDICRDAIKEYIKSFTH